MSGSYTTNYSLYKPAGREVLWQTLVNVNFDTIDTTMKAHADLLALKASAADMATALAGKAALSHTHAQSEITNLVSALAAKAALASPALTGTPTAPTAAAGTNSTQIATTAFVETARGKMKTAVASDTVQVENANEYSTTNTTETLMISGYAHIPANLHKLATIRFKANVRVSNTTNHSNVIIKVRSTGATLATITTPPGSSSTYVERTVDVTVGANAGEYLDVYLYSGISAGITAYMQDLRLCCTESELPVTWA